MTKTVTREQIKQKLDAQAEMVIIETLPKRYYESKHLPGAINIPHNEIQHRAPQILPDKNALIVLYCSNTACRNSKLATDTLQQMGYTNAYEYVEGKKHWIAANLPTETGLETEK